jgi:hypothetical protein
MDQHDQELLDRQVGRIAPLPRSDGVMLLAIMAVFFGGMALGGFLFGYESGPTRIAADNAPPALSFPHAPLTIRQYGG